MADAQKVKTELQQECDTLRRELELCKSDEVQKEAALTELKKQCSDLLGCRGVEVNLLLNKPSDKISHQGSQEEIREAGKKKKGNTKAAKNLQFAKDLNREMELMFADDDFQMKPTGKAKRKENRQRQVAFAAGSTGNRELPLVQGTLLQNQIQAA